MASDTADVYTRTLVAEASENQSIPTEWHAFEHAGETIVSQDLPESTVCSFVATRATTNPQIIARADAVIYDGKILEPWFNEDYRTVELSHRWAGMMAKARADEELDEPAVLLEKLPSAEATDR